MAQGAVSDAVAQLQRTLVHCYGANIAIDKNFGPATKSALISAQRAENIAADGIYGPETLHGLEWYHNGNGFCGYAAEPIYLPSA